VAQNTARRIPCRWRSSGGGACASDSRLAASGSSPRCRRVRRQQLAADAWATSQLLAGEQAVVDVRQDWSPRWFVATDFSTAPGCARRDRCCAAAHDCGKTPARAALAEPWHDHRRPRGLSSGPTTTTNGSGRTSPRCRERAADRRPDRPFAQRGAAVKQAAAGI
jgi:hypothetical protein